MNVIDACIDCGVKSAVALSTDKASSPINLYGATKLASDKLFVAGNAYSNEHGTKFSVVRYGNVMGSRGSVIPYFEEIKKNGFIPITDKKMTRFMISLDQAIELVWHAFDDMVGGEIYVKKIPSMKITDLASAIAPNVEQKIIGIRPGEKLHEQMIGEEDALSTYEFKNHYKILPVINDWNIDPLRIQNGKKVNTGFTYNSETNDDWMSQKEFKDWLKANREKIGKL